MNCLSFVLFRMCAYSRLPNLGGFLTISNVGLEILKNFIFGSKIFDFFNEIFKKNVKIQFKKKIKSSKIRKCLKKIEKIHEKTEKIII